jgi:hypothetical protein
MPKEEGTTPKKRSKSGVQIEVAIQPPFCPMLQNPPSARHAALSLAYAIVEVLESDEPLSRDDAESLLIAVDLLAGLTWATRLKRNGEIPREAVAFLSLRLSE